jgi:hypothetical protein
MGVPEDSMTRTTHSLALPDISAAARSLARDLAETPAPGHLSLMNMLARAAGFRNFQHLKASGTAEDRMAAPAAPMPDQTRVAQALNHFDAQGRLMRWPSKTWLQKLCLWAVWARLPDHAVLSERAFSQVLNGLHLFGDAALLRRTLWEMALITRTEDCRDYRRAEQKPPPEALSLIRALKQRHG